jgi:hypothetical protein
MMWIAFSITLSIVSCNWLWFARSGSILTLTGGVLAARRLIRLGVKEFFHAEHMVDGGHAAPTPDETESDRQEYLDIQAAHIGFWFIIIGTIIWAYGDLL